MNSTQAQEIAKLIQQTQITDMRRVSKFSRNWLKAMLLIKPGKMGWSVVTYMNWRDLPAAVLHEIMKPALESTSGLNGLSVRKEWEALNIFPAISRSHSNKDAMEMFNVMCELHQAGYINFQSAGSIWRW